MTWFVAVVAAMVLMAVAALAIPVHFTFAVELTDRLRGRAHVRWWFVEDDVSSGTATTPRRRRRPRPARTRQRGSALDVLRTPGLLRRVGRLVRDVVSRIHVREFQLHARYGLDDPADTGQVCGLLAPALVWSSTRSLDVQLVPDFTRPTIEGMCSGAVSVRPLAVLATILAFLLSRPVWRAARIWRHPA